MQNQQQTTNISSMFGEYIKTAQTMLSPRFLQINWENLADFQRRWNKQFSVIQGERKEAATADKVDHLDSMLRWTHWFEDETRRFLNIPQLGLTRYYQENINLAMDKYNAFQGRLGEFLCHLFKPVKKSLEVLQNDVVEMADNSKAPEESKLYYDKWIKNLETQYMVLFNSSEYICSLGETIRALDDFIQARSSVLEDVLKMIPVPTTSEMDALYEEIYHLKKRLRDLEKNQPMKPREGKSRRASEPGRQG